MKLSKKMLTVLIVAGAIAIVVVVKLVLANLSMAVDPVAARAIGPQGAQVNIVEFIDFECPACAHGTKILKEYLALYPSQIRVQVKYYPLMNMHKHALQSAAYAECTARQGKFWEFLEPLMAQQQQWSQLINAQDIFNQMARGAGADLNKLQACLSLQDVSETIMNEKTLGRSKGVQSTPTYFVNDKMVVGTKALTQELDKYFPKAK